MVPIRGSPDIAADYDTSSPILARTLKDLFERHSESDRPEIVWEWQVVAGGSWERYNADECAIIENAFVSELSQVDVDGKI